MDQFAFCALTVCICCHGNVQGVNRFKSNLRNVRRTKSKQYFLLRRSPPTDTKVAMQINRIMNAVTIGIKQSEIHAESHPGWARWLQQLKVMSTIQSFVTGKCAARSSVRARSMHKGAHNSPVGVLRVCSALAIDHGLCLCCFSFDAP